MINSNSASEEMEMNKYKISQMLEDERTISLKPTFGYMEKQNFITDGMRAILVDWLIDVHSRFKFKEETLYQTIWIMDTFLSKSIISREKLQLLGVASLLISSKCQEVLYPSLDDLVTCANYAFDKKDLLEMEKLILKVLEFDILAPTSNDFYNMIAEVFNFDEKQYYMGKFALDLSLVDYNMINYPQSVLAAASSYFVMKFFGVGNYQLLFSNDFVNGENPRTIIKNAARDICILLGRLSNLGLKAVKEKYSKPKYHNIVENFVEIN